MNATAERVSERLSAQAMTAVVVARVRTLVAESFGISRRAIGGYAVQDAEVRRARAVLAVVCEKVCACRGVPNAGRRVADCLGVTRSWLDDARGSVRHWAEVEPEFGKKVWEVQRRADLEKYDFYE